MTSNSIGELSGSELAQMVLFAFAVGFILLTPFVWIFGRTVALKKRPDERALWTAALAYAGATLVIIFFGSEVVSVWQAPLVSLPGALIIFFWQRYIYRKAWLEDHEVTEGMSLENDDWRMGIVIVLTLLVASAIKALILK